MSSVLELITRLNALGLIPRGQFSLVEIRHDSDCPSLWSQSSLDCNCDCEVVVGRRSYLHSQFVAPKGER
jgi:hypothetical protein